MGFLQSTFQTFLSLSFALNGNAFSIPSASTLKARQNLAGSPHLAVLGDSWGSGVAYSPFSTYDNNKNFCLRYNQAYGAQLEADKGWSDSKTNTMQFVACSGSRLASMTTEGLIQMDELSGSVDAVIITNGGNNVGFFAIADACIYHSNITHDYGPAFPDPEGECQQAIDTATKYIHGTVQGSALLPDLRATYRDMLNKDVTKNNGALKFYHTGYGHFFSVEGEGDDDWCTKDNVSFNIPALGFAAGKNPSSLTKDLRTKINDLVQQVNDGIHTVTEETEFSDRFGYVDISPAFNTHRFCEVGSNKNAQYYSSDVWLWNVVAPGLGAVADNIDPKPADLDQNPDFQFGDAPVVTQDTLSLNQVNLFSDPSNGNSLIRGWMLRPFHPKGQAYTKIKDIITARLKQDNIPGAVVPEQITQDMCICNENSCNYDCCANGTCPPK